MQRNQQAPNYSYKIFWSDEDKEFVATFIEIPSLSGLGSTPQEAIRELTEVLTAWLQVAEERGLQLPKPIQERIPLVLLDIGSLGETERFPNIFLPFQYISQSQTEEPAIKEEKIKRIIDVREGTTVTL